MIVDVHTHLSTLEQWGPAFREAFGRNYADSGIDLHVTPRRHRDAARAADKVIAFGINSHALKMQTPNDAIAAYAEEHTDKVIGFMSIDPNQPDALDELDRCVQDLGLRGLKMSPVYQCFDPWSPAAERIHARADELGLPILTHAAMQAIIETPMEWANPLRYDRVARQFPGLKIILAHMGLPWFTDAMVMVRKNPNVYADISGTIFRPWWMYQAMVSFHESDLLHKLLFASDFPFATIEETMLALRHVNDVIQGTGLPRIPPDHIEGIIHRDSLALLSLA